MTFFLDNNLSPILAEGLRAFGEDVRHLREVFPPDTPDEVWLPEIGQRGWFLVTHDKRIPRKASQLQALLQAGGGCIRLHAPEEAHPLGVGRARSEALG